MEILAVTGTNGSGKGTFVRFLEEEGYIHYSARDLLLEEIDRRGLGNDRNVMNSIGNTLRQENGPDYVVRELLRRAKEKGSSAVIESVRCPAEAKYLKEAGAILLAVDDPALIRYERIVKRKHSTDNVSFEEFIEQERKESVGTEGWDMNIPVCIAQANFIFNDNGDFDSFRKKVHIWVDRHLDKKMR